MVETYMIKYDGIMCQVLIHFAKLNFNEKTFNHLLAGTESLLEVCYFVITLPNKYIKL